MKFIMIASYDFIFNHILTLLCLASLIPKQAWEGGGGRIHQTAICSKYKQDFSFDLPMTYNKIIVNAIKNQCMHA